MARFTVTYWLAADNAADAQARALDVATEQTVEIPRDIVPDGYVRDEILGQVETITPSTDSRGGFLATLSYSEDDVGGDFLQLLNIVFGNSSIKTGTRVETMSLSEGLKALCPGPRFGAEGLRQRTGAHDGPILMSAIKPVGLPTSELAKLAHDFALGGMHMVKDDHGLANQHTSPYADRLKACVDAIAAANAKTGFTTTYVPNITGPAREVFDRAFMAKEAGAGGVMLAPSLVGFDVARTLAADESFGLPIISHPTFGGANVITPTTGFSHRFFYGQMQRMMGVDAVVYPNFGGRFGFSRDECLSIVAGCSDEFGGLKPILPAPGGGMTLERVPEMQAAYGKDVIYLIGGALLRDKANLPAACQRLVEAVR
ncbi:RuBisCO large subunit C-terminal-like domain-containing protein [Mariluticola halotolerans]|uniref:RuBisCO large subunit C-terminal-like domain-containing protein n=1 Tax=Mariluticola halotolerans TaxID=2909283 RepID=UPI0026E2057F|nr:RuBisCO large subunit C-terminal-like domain-containing protein [Mariluticola halotolerans]UJQ96109.1 RuBisCO large subunit C-terminal-like domain-containing protein [Mariluticola halotolerans]